MTSNRRDFLKRLAGAGVAAAIPGPLPSFARGPYGHSAADTAAPGSFDFVFFTDTHIQPELAAAKGCAMCFEKIASLAPDFAINGGDHVFDVLEVSAGRATMLFDLYAKTQASLAMPLHHTIGNHDVFGILAKSGASPSDPNYGKKLYEDRLGKPTYYAFEHKGYHFVVLDSIQPTADRLWEARIDEAQLHWLEEQLTNAGHAAPVVIVSHVPLISAFSTYASSAGPVSKYPTLTVGNSAEVMSLFAGHNVIAVLQGHLHINEIVSYRGIQYITNGAVCGNWWRGPRLGVPEGFTVVSLRAGKLSTGYKTYGFQSVARREKP